jgi:aminoglycoside phosphotransferase family enzyme
LLNLGPIASRFKRRFRQTGVGLEERCMRARVGTTMNSTASRDEGAEAASVSVSIADKLRFLSEPSAFPHSPQDVTLMETHMSFVFLAGNRAYKLKKPVRFPFLDFSTLRAREINCQEELRLNRRLASEVYLAIVPLNLSADNRLSLDGDGAVVDWLVVMRRLPADRMLDRMLIEGRLDDRLIDELCGTLSDFYRRAERSAISPGTYAARFFREQAENRRVLTRREFALDHGRIPHFLDRLDAILTASRPLLEERVHLGHIVDGHGDLRPEHICFADPIAIFDCLEFNSELRQVDPFDELAYLGLESAQLRFPALGPKIIAKVADRLGESPPHQLVSLYTAWRAVLRARLAVAHLLDPVPRRPERWEPLASRYLRLAEQALAAADS